jgi:hypothetical protein
MGIDSSAFTLDMLIKGRLESKDAECEFSKDEDEEDPPTTVLIEELS